MLSHVKEMHGQSNSISPPVIKTEKSPYSHLVHTGVTESFRSLHTVAHIHLFTAEMILLIAFRIVGFLINHYRIQT